MTPNFALSLSFEGIRLLHRAADGWRLVGDVSLETEDLPGALSVLLDSAKALAPEGVACKLVIPEGQIRYLTIETGNADEAARWVAARAALDGATPYAVSDLVFDLISDGPQTHIAAVARETLGEAEAFAAGYGFGPVSFVALVGDGQPFAREPFFGETEHFRRTFGPAAHVERDQDPIHVVGPAEARQPGELSDAPLENAPVEDAPIAHDAAAKAEDGRVEEPEAPDVPLPPPEPEAEDTGRIDTGNIDSGATNTGITTPSEAQAPAVEPMGGKAAEEEEDGPQVTFRSLARAKHAPSDADTSASIGFSSRRAKAEAAAPLLGGVTREPPRISVDAPSLPGDDAKPARPAPIAQPASSAAATLAPDVIAERSEALAIARTRARHTASAVVETDEAARMTIFGAREGDAAIGGKPRHLGLMLTVSLVIFMAGVAAWSSVFSDGGIARLFSGRDEPVLAAPSEAPETLPNPLPPEAAPAPERELAALDTGPNAGLTDEDAAVLDALREARPDPLPPIAENPDDYYARTGIWSGAPVTPQPAALVPLDTLYEPSVDRSTHQRESHDAVALQPPATRRNDVLPLPFSSPTAPGTAFRLDARGLVIPTPEGVLNPDGVRVFAGKPPKVPPATPDRTARQIEELDPQAQRLAAIRPPSRPATLVEDNARAARTGPEQSELAAFRPVLRPALERTPEEQAAEEPDAPAAEPVVLVSRKPNARPKNFDRIVARATPRQEQPAAVRIPTRTVTPNIPTTASVARQATERNALNFRRINLIGVYGTPSDRRALVLLSNGRYKKVKVGDTLDGGQVSAIGDSELRYQKRGRNLVLKMPQG